MAPTAETPHCEHIFPLLNTVAMLTSPMFHAWKYREELLVWFGVFVVVVVVFLVFCLVYFFLLVWFIFFVGLVWVVLCVFVVAVCLFVF